MVPGPFPLLPQALGAGQLSGGQGENMLQREPRGFRGRRETRQSLPPGRQQLLSEIMVPPRPPSKDSRQGRGAVRAERGDPSSPAVSPWGQSEQARGRGKGRNQPAVPHVPPSLLPEAPGACPPPPAPGHDDSAITHACSGDRYGGRWGRAAASLSNLQRPPTLRV